MVFARGASWEFRVVRKNKNIFPSSSTSSELMKVKAPVHPMVCGKVERNKRWSMETPSTNDYSFAVNKKAPIWAPFLFCLDEDASINFFSVDGSFLVAPFP